MSRSEAHHAADQLEYRVFTATRRGLTPDIPAGYESLAWVANSATLIYGTRDTVLVDTFLTLDQSVQLADEVAASGKNLTYVYITRHAQMLFFLHHGYRVIAHDRRGHGRSAQVSESDNGVPLETIHR